MTFNLTIDNTQLTQKIDDIDAYLVTLRLVGEKGATDIDALTQAVTEAVAAIDPQHSLYVVEPVLGFKEDIGHGFAA